MRAQLNATSDLADTLCSGHSDEGAEVAQTEKKRPHKAAACLRCEGYFIPHREFVPMPGRGVPCIGSSDAGSDDSNPELGIAAMTVSFSPAAPGTSVRTPPNAVSEMSHISVRQLPYAAAMPAAGLW